MDNRGKVLVDAAPNPTNPLDPANPANTSNPADLTGAEGVSVAGAPTLLAINNYHYPRGGAEAVFFEEARQFQELGWNVVPFSMQHPQNIASKWSDYFIEEIEFGQDYGLIEKVRKGAKTVYSFEARAKLEQLLERVDCSIVHMHNIYHHISPSILSVLKKHGLPTVITLHDLKLACPAYKMLRDGKICEACKGGRTSNVLKNRCIKDSVVLSSLVYFESLLHSTLGSYRNNVDKFIVPSRFYKDKLVEWGWPEERFAYVANCVDAFQYQPNLEPGKHFAYFGRLSEEKGLATLVEAVAKAGQPLRLIGTGPEEAKLRALAEQTGADVHFAGFLTGEALHREVASARAVVLPSEWYENAPISLMEAYALGKPVLGADIGGIPELVRAGETGWTFPSGSVDELADRLRDIAHTKDSVISAMGSCGRQWMADDFSAARHRDRLLEVYADVGLQTTADTRMEARTVEQ